MSQFVSEQLGEIHTEKCRYFVTRIPQTVVSTLGRSTSHFNPLSPIASHSSTQMKMKQQHAHESCPLECRPCFHYKQNELLIQISFWCVCTVGILVTCSAKSGCSVIDRWACLTTATRECGIWSTALFASVPHDAPQVWVGSGILASNLYSSQSFTKRTKKNWRMPIATQYFLKQ